MLTNSRNYKLDSYDEIDFIHNYYERLVVEEIFAQSSRVQAGDRDFLADVACVALNRMPPRYIRHDVDMTFFMSPQDIQEISNKVIQAVSAALNYVESRERGEDIKLPAVDVSLIANRASKPTKAAKNSDEVKQSAKPKAPKK
jgi:Late competence development protein ComFB